MDKITNYILNENKQLQEQEITPASVIEAAENAGQIGPAKHVTGVEIDLNNFDEPGKYYFGSGGTYANMPDGVTNGYLTVNYTTESGPVQQILIGHNARIYLRTKGSSSASWTAWTTIANLSDMPGVMTGATESQAGTQGIVPAPAAGKQGSYLMGNGTWGRDADVLAAIAAGQIGAAKYVQGEDLDLNTFSSPGKYYFGSSGTYANMPPGVTSGYLTVNYVTESGPVQQMLIGHNARIYLRTKGTSSASWTAWTTIANLSDIPEPPGVMTGATSSQPGTSGIVPAPAAGKQGELSHGKRHVGT